MHDTFLYHVFCYNINEYRKIVKNIAHITASIIQKTQQLNIQSSGPKLVKLCYLVGSVDRRDIYFHMTCLLPIYGTLLPQSYLYLPAML